MSEHKIKVTADSMEQFKEISKKLETLPDAVKNNIERVQRGLVGIECFVKSHHGPTSTIYLPANTTQIKHFDDFIGIYCDPFFIRIEGDMAKKPTNYVFIKE